MREILFRGKRVDNGKWVYGVPIKKALVGSHDGYYPKIIPECDGRHQTVYSTAIKEETIGQYTGLKDKNGTRVFEGDIVKYNGSIHKVVFENRCYNARFGIVVEEKETWSFGMSVPPYLMEVIGNIHDNPELMGGNTNG